MVFYEMFEQPTESRKKSKAETEKNGKGVGGSISRSVPQGHSGANQILYTGECSLSTAQVCLWEGGRGRNPPANSTEFCLRNYSELGNVCTGNHGRLFSKPAG